MKRKESTIKDNYFVYNLMKFDCTRAIKKDIECIVRQAEATNKEEFHELYKTDSIKPEKVKLFVDDNDNIVYTLILYTIEYKDGNLTRCACGNYYPVKRNTLFPHSFQGSICW